MYRKLNVYKVEKERKTVRKLLKKEGYLQPTV